SVLRKDYAELNHQNTTTQQGANSEPSSFAAALKRGLEGSDRAKVTTIIRGEQRDQKRREINLIISGTGISPTCTIGDARAKVGQICTTLQAEQPNDEELSTAVRITLAPT